MLDTILNEIIKNTLVICDKFNIYSIDNDYQTVCFDYSTDNNGDINTKIGYEVLYDCNYDYDSPSVDVNRIFVKVDLNITYSSYDDDFSFCYKMNKKYKYKEGINSIIRHVINDMFDMIKMSKTTLHNEIGVDFKNV